MMAVGVANPRAQGQAMTNTEVKTRSTNSASRPAMAHRMAATTAIAITTGTKTPATRSAIFEIGALRPCASSMILMILERVVSSPTRSTRTCMAPL